MAGEGDYVECWWKWQGREGVKTTGYIFLPTSFMDSLFHNKRRRIGELDSTGWAGQWSLQTQSILRIDMYSNSQPTSSTGAMLQASSDSILMHQFFICNYKRQIMFQFQFSWTVRSSVLWHLWHLRWSWYWRLSAAGNVKHICEYFCYTFSDSYVFFS